MNTSIRDLENSGLTFQGYVSHPRVNEGSPVPNFTMNGNLNTLEGWNAAAMEANRRSYAAVTGKEPTSDHEFMDWVRSYAAQAAV